MVNKILAEILWIVSSEVWRSNKHFKLHHTFKYFIHTVEIFDFFVLLLCSIYICVKYLNKQYTAKDMKLQEISANSIDNFAAGVVQEE